MTSGTTFAARARAAELNAVRARKASKELESDDDLVSTAPVALSAFTKFTKPRNRGRAWKALNLDEVHEASADPDNSSNTYTTFGELSFPKTRGTTGDDRQPFAFPISEIESGQNPASRAMLHGSNAVTSPDLESEPSPESKNLARIVADYDVEEWNPDMPLATVGNKSSMTRASSSHLATLQQPRPTITRQPSNNSSNKKEADLGSSLLVAMSEGNQVFAEGQRPVKDTFGQDAKLVGLGVHPTGATKTLGIPEEARLARLGVLPPVQRGLMMQGPSGNRSAVPPPFTPRFIPSTEPYGVPTSSYLNSTNGGNTHPGHGQMDFNFRFPHGSHVQQHQQSQFYQGQTQYMSNATHHAHQSTHMASPPQDYMPSYDIPASSKKEMLLQGLHNVVESSKAHGGISSSARTVLYDPEARSTAKEVTPTNAAIPQMASKTEKGLLLASEELPWKDRPVNIHTVVTPILSNADLAALNKASTLQITPPTLAAVDGHRAGANLPSDGRLDGAEKWWHTDVRGQEEIRKYVEQAADSHLSVRMSPAIGNTRPLVSQAALLGDSSITFTNQSQVASPDVTDLMVPLLATLHSYVTDTSKQNAGYFGRYARVPEWCIDKGQGGENSFFGEDWGAPPPRVGRDPRYRPLLHEGRYTVFEEMGLRTGTGYRW
ncbi:MAG: hypothetical protein LQ347_003486 [Umbilicaria vellea]|nr:MAG: hypothetical protein LQ347_003486 [Umbilicaria vellea]